jgi:peptide/nickel transport system permease protein
VLQKIVETFCFPPILLAIAIVSLFGAQSHHRADDPALDPYARLTRAQANTRSRDFVSASMIMGGGTVWILRRHIIPNVFASAVVVATFSMATAIIAEASEASSGWACRPAPRWGGMLADGRSITRLVARRIPGPGIFQSGRHPARLLGDWLRDQLDPDDLNLV